MTDTPELLPCLNSLTGEHKWLEKVGKNKDKPDQCVYCKKLREDLDRAAWNRRVNDD